MAVSLTVYKSIVQKDKKFVFLPDLHIVPSITHSTTQPSLEREVRKYLLVTYHESSPPVLTKCLSSRVKRTLVT